MHRVIVALVALLAGLLLASCDGQGDASGPAKTATGTEPAPPASTELATGTVSPVPVAEYSPGPYDPNSGTPIQPITLVPPPDVETAEAEAAIWLPDATPPPAPPEFEGVAGTSEDRCVPIQDGLVRSRDWVAHVSESDEGDGTLELRPTNLEELVGLRNALFLRARLLGGDEGGRTHVHHFHGPPSSTPGGAPSYRVGLELPSTGQWLVVATAGPNWGCFLITVDTAASMFDGTDAAERLGTAYPQATPPTDAPEAFDSKALDDPAAWDEGRTCVPSPQARRARSGEFVLHGAANYVGTWLPLRPLSKMVVFPLHDEHLRTDADTSRPRLRIKGVLEHDPAHTYAYETDWALQAVDPETGERGDYSGHAVIALPRAGTWVLTSEWANNWGCFLMSVGEHRSGRP